jgi:hypothetical protein
MSPELLAELHKLAGTPTNKEEVVNMMSVVGASPKEIENIFKDYLILNDQPTAYNEGDSDGRIMLARKIMKDLGQIYELPDGFIELDTTDNVARAF